MFMEIASSEAVFGPTPGMVSRQRQVSSRSSRAAMASSSASISAAFSAILRAKSLTAQPSAAIAAASGFVEDPTDSMSSLTLSQFAPRARAAVLRPLASAIDHGLPGAAIRRSSAASDRSTNASNSGHDSSRMLRSLFLFLVFSQIRKSLCAVMDLAAAIAGSGWATGSSASGMPNAVLAMTVASRSSVLASPPKSFEASCAAGRRQPARRGIWRKGKRARFPCWRRARSAAPRRRASRRTPSATTSRRRAL